MTAFVKEDFEVSAGYVFYRVSPTDRRFMARFKYGGASSARPYASFVRKHFTQEEYWARRETECPLRMAESKGFVMTHMKRWMRERGLDPIAANLPALHALLRGESEAYRARLRGQPAATQVLPGPVTVEA